MRVSARSDYALRAVAELAVAGDARLKREVIAERQGIPFEFLESALLALKHAAIRVNPEFELTRARPHTVMTTFPWARMVSR